MNETTIDISEFSQVTDITVADGDNLLLSRADGTAARISLDALKIVLGRVFASVSALNTEADARATADTGLTNLLKGKIDSGALAGRHPFVMLGDFETWDDVNEALDTLATDTTAYKYTGRVRFSKTGANYECMMHVLSYQNAVWVQMCSGALSVSGGKLAAGDAFAQYRRRCENGTLGAWTEYPDMSGYATTVALQEETTARVAAGNTLANSVSEALATALGNGTQTTWKVPVKVVNGTSERQIFVREANTRLLSGVSDDRGWVSLRYSRTGGHYLLFSGGLIETGYAANAARGCVQFALGNLKIGTGTTDDLGHDWAEDGVPNGLAISYNEFNLLWRKVHYPGNVRTVTPWVEYKGADETMRPLYLINNSGGSGAPGAPVYDADTDTYSLNGLTDITPAQMRVIYSCSHFTFGMEGLAGKLIGMNIRTNYAWNVYWIQGGARANTSAAFSAKQAFARCSYLEVVRFCTTRVNTAASPLYGFSQFAPKFTDYIQCFYGCTVLRDADRLDLNTATQNSPLFQMFHQCAALEEVRIENLKISGLSFADSPNLSAASVAYLVANAANTSAITVTVNGNTLLYISAGQDEWAGIEEAAAARNITFVS